MLEKKNYAAAWFEIQRKLVTSGYFSLHNSQAGSLTTPCKLALTAIVSMHTRSDTQMDSGKIVHNTKSCYSENNLAPHQGFQ